jgi:hypothetical protein
MHYDDPIVKKLPSSDAIYPTILSDVFFENGTVFGKYEKLDTPIPIFNVVVAEIDNTDDLKNYMGTFGYTFDNQDEEIEFFYADTDEKFCEILSGYSRTLYEEN